MAHSKLCLVYVSTAYPALFIGAVKNKTPSLFGLGVLSNKSLTMTYFHRRTSTIIGAKAFHGPVRDGKEWDHLAMVVKRNRVFWPLWGSRNESGKKHRALVVIRLPGPQGV
jgi:hypothetical protein